MSCLWQRADQSDLQKVLLRTALRATDQDARGEDERTAQNDLEEARAINTNTLASALRELDRRPTNLEQSCSASTKCP